MPERTDYFDEKDAIVTAVLLGDFSATEFLVKRGADINAQDEIGRTAVIMAIEEDWAGTAWVEYLLENGADIHILDKDGDSALDIAKYRRRTDIVEFLLAHGAKGKDGPSSKELCDDSIYAAFDQANAVKRLASEIEKKTTLEVRMPFNETPVEIKSQDYWFKIVEFLQQNWALIDETAGGCTVFFFGSM